MRNWLHRNSLSLTMFGLFLLFLAGQAVAGHREYNEDQRAHGEPAVSLAAYLSGPHFVEAVFENWESEFLQMGSFVLLTVWLRQKGSPESKPLEGQEPVDADPRRSHGKDRPWPARRGGLILKVYENSLSIALFSLFAASFALHALGGTGTYNKEQLVHGEPTVSVIQYVGTSRFWFESFQNWQSEFLSVGALAVLAIFLRQRGSPESKPVAAPNSETGT
ncbi:MAG: DUF6766 family protein [Actinomycetota bacterium]